MRIWVDADAAPKPIKEMMFRAAERKKIEVVLVANQSMRIPRSKFVRLVVVGKGFDVADDYISQNIEAGDLLVTQDIPLAAEAVEKGALVFDVRGKVIDKSNARVRLASRDLREEARLSGEMTGGPKPFSNKDKQRFAGALDRWLAKL